MLYVAGTWIVIGISAFLWGEAVLGLLGIIRRSTGSGVALRIMTGLCVLTVYAEFFSLFYKVGALALCGVFLVDVCVLIAKRKTLLRRPAEEKKRALLWKGLGTAAAFIIVLPIAASYIKNPDTLLYHAQAIRWIEEYGVVRGIGNLHSRLAMNSAFLSLQALFSMKSIAGQSMHSMNSFVAWVMLSYAVCSMKFWKQKRFFVSDFLRAAMLFFLSAVAFDFSSPGTDFFAQILTMYIFTEFTSVMESGEKDPGPYAVLSVLSVYAFTLKLSCAPVVLLTVAPAIMLLKEKDWRAIGLYILAGVLIMIPFCARGYLISGYLIYPMERIDLFRPDWKVPADLVWYERMRTKAWCEHIFGIEDLEAPLSVWLPYWKEATRTSTIRLFCADIVSCAAILIAGAVYWKKEKNTVYLVIGAVFTACLAYWFFFAPDIRFGRHCLLMPVFFALGSVLSGFRPREIAVVSVAGMTLLMASPLISLFGYARAEERFFVKCADYGLCDVEEVTIGDVKLYLPLENNEAGYYEFPAIHDRQDGETVELRGSTVRDGFRLKQQAD